MRAQVRAVAGSVEQDAVEARDVTREYVDQEALLRNAHAEEEQYLVILERATSVQDSKAGSAEFVVLVILKQSPFAQIFKIHVLSKRLVSPLL